MARHAEVAGAGIAGLTAATVLAQGGWSVRVHEKGHELREIGAGIFMWENGIRSLEALGAWDDASRHAERTDCWELRDQRGRLLQGEWVMGGARLFLVLRTELHRALAEAATRAGAEIVTNSTVSHATANGVLEDETRLRADLVVGADGVHSRVRDFLQLGLVVRDLEDGCSRHLIPRSEDDPREITVEYWQGGRRIGVCPCSPDQVYVYLCCPARDARGARTLSTANRGRPAPRTFGTSSSESPARRAGRASTTCRAVRGPRVASQSWETPHTRCLRSSARARAWR